MDQYKQLAILIREGAWKNTMSVEGAARFIKDLCEREVKDALNRTKAKDNLGKI